jgi:hypothetical protein
MGVCVSTIIPLTILDTFRIGDFMNYTFRHVTTCSLPVRYHTDLRALIASVKCLDMSIKLRFMVTETILCGFQSPHSQRRVATHMIQKSYGFEFSQLQIQKRTEFSTQSRLTIVDNSELIPEANRPGDESTTKSITTCISMDALKYSEATNRGIN